MIRPEQQVPLDRMTVGHYWLIQTPSQVMIGRFDYWEESVPASRDASGVGYLEMMGY
ncbi:hypothetical protein ACJ5N2_11670 [Aeromonas salmonicida]|uniref:hypothetical protein n=1 Tax=Aeromonas salmonicida TaxID=645 RepID=UPI0038BA5733